VADKHNRPSHRISFKNSYFRGLRMTLSCFRRFGAAAVLMSFAAAPALGANQQVPPRGWWRTEAIVKDLGLTAEQTARLDAIFERAFPDLRLEREELERLESKLSRMIQDDRVDEASLARQIDRVETARASGNKTRSMMLTRMYRVLTRDQRVRFDALSKQWASTPPPGRAPRAGSTPAPHAPSGAARPPQ
jgi:Spy/CpxP family protein refolding chaperone